MHSFAYNPTPKTILKYYAMYNVCTHTHTWLYLADLSARTILVFVTFSMVNLVFPPVPATRPIARDKWSPFNGFTERKWAQQNNETIIILVCTYVHVRM